MPPALSLKMVLVVENVPLLASVPAPWVKLPPLTLTPPVAPIVNEPLLTVVVAKSIRVSKLLTVTLPPALLVRLFRI